MLQDTFADLEGKIQAIKARVAFFEHIDNAQGMKVMLEPLAEPGHLPIQFQFTGMAKRRMPKIVCQSQGFGELFV